MIPFLKKKEGGASMGQEDEPTWSRKPDDDEDGHFLLDAIADDLLEAVSKQDRTLLRHAIDALCEHILNEIHSHPE
jgi:hypothetical protein